MDIVHMCMQHDVKGLQLASAAARYMNFPAPDPERVPNAFMITWEYDNFLVSFTNVITPRPEAIRGGPGFFGSRGYLLVNRSGYIVRSTASQSFQQAPMPPLEGRGGKGARPQAAPPPPAGQPPLAAQDLTLPDAVVAERACEVVHVRNWLDCIKSRQKPVADIEIGFHSTLPCLLGVQAIREKRSFAWDPKTKTAKAV
jgi:hypothetical protein